MAKAGEEVNLSALFADLNRFGQNQEFGKALNVCDKILREAPEDDTAFQCKVVCMMQLDKFEEALKTITRNNTLSGNLVFEKAYCQYRLNRTEDALRSVERVSEPDLRVQELHAQILYRLERYEECFSVYKALMKNTQDEYDDERETNLSAVMAALQLSGQDMDDGALREETYEMCYNKGCFLLGKGQYKEAETMLRQAEEMCQKSMEDDPDNTEEDIEEELGVIRVQLGYALQRLGKADQGLKLYNQVVKQKPSDQALLAVASNNIVTLNKDQNVFDSKKKIKVATADNLKQKLTSQQREVIAMNQGLLYLYTSQNDQCRKHCRSMLTTYPDNEMPRRILAAQYTNDKQVAKAIDVVKDYTSSHPDSTMQLHLTLAQLYLSSGSVYQVCDTLKAMGEERYAPGLVAALVSLYKSQEDSDSAVEVLSDAIGWYKKNQPNSTKLPTLMRASANLLMASGKPQEAASVLENLKKLNPKDSSTLAQLISAYSKFDQNKAHAISRELPSPKELAASVDVDTLESTFTTLKSRYARKAGKDAAVPSPKSGPSGDKLLEKKRKKKKKKILPKNYDSSVDPDPERWLPKRERSYYKSKRKDKRKDVGKGTQGAGIVNPDLDASKPASAVPKTPATPTESPREQATGPRQQKPQAASKKKKKKGKGGW